MINAVLSHYRIVRELGAGGMGVVYLAEDVRLGRHVAVKVLPQEYAANAERTRRFEQEARATSALNHPNIVTVHDIGETSGTRFIVTEYIDGETLRARLRGRRLSAAEAVRISIQIAEALAAAHRIGVVHRDLKPENIMVRGDGYAKVLDFGLAKLNEPTDPSPHDPTLTRPGVVLGTLRYMSPEQARGVAVDRRSDIFSLGVVMYEMLAGTNPFRGDTAADVVASILQSSPAPLRSVAPDVPPELEACISTALAKDPTERHQNAETFASALKRISHRMDLSADLPTVAFEAAPRSRTRISRAALLGAMAVVVIAAIVAALVNPDAGRRASRGPIDTVAVLPFVNTADASFEYLSEGITESLINDLSALPGLRVRSWNAVAPYKVHQSGRYDVRRVAGELDVWAVVVGRVARHGDRLTVNAELIDARDNTQIWGERFDRDAAEVLAVQREIAANIAEGLRITLGGPDRQSLARRETTSSEAYELYLKGRYFVNKRSAESIRVGRDHFLRAIDSDPLYALAYAGVSDSYALLAAQAALPPSQAYPAALAAARKATELDPMLAEGHASLAHAALHRSDLQTAEREFGRAIALKPNYVPAYFWQSEYFMATGQLDQALAAARKAASIDPVDLGANVQVANVLIARKEYAQAIVEARKALEIDRDYFRAHSALGRAYAGQQRFPEAIAAFEEVARLTAGSRGPGHLGLLYAGMGRTADARRVLREMQMRSREHYVDAMELARIHAALRERKETIHWLALAGKDAPEVVRSTTTAPEFAFLHADREYLEVIRGLPAQASGAPAPPQ